MRIGALLAPAAPRLRLLAGRGELDRVVSGVVTTDLHDPGRYLQGGELVLTGMLWRSGADDSERFVRGLAAAGAVGLAAGEAEVGPVPEDLVAACERHRMPLFAVPEDVAFAQLTEYVVRQVSADRAADLSALVDRHRALVSASGGAGLDAVLELLGGDLDLDCWVLTPSGRVVAGPPDRLNPAERDQLVRAHLDGQRRRSGPSVRARVATRQFSVLPVPAEGAGLLAQWLLAVEGDVTEWTPKRQQLAENLARLAAAERERRDESRRLRSRLADEVFTLLQRDAPPEELSRALEASLAMAQPVDGPGSPESWVVVSAEGVGLPDGAVRAALVEALTGADDRALIGGGGTGAVLLVPEPADGTAMADLLRSLLGPLEAGLGAEGRLTLGASAPAASAGGLRGALEEARHARRIAAARIGRIEELTGRDLSKLEDRVDFYLALELS